VLGEIRIANVSGYKTYHLTDKSIHERMVLQWIIFLRNGLWFVNWMEQLHKCLQIMGCYEYFRLITGNFIAKCLRSRVYREFP
jgi:hypothetical protein